MTSVEQLITDNLDIWSSAVKTKASVGRGASNKKELYGIKKLRELILDLAVSGLLVPKIEGDEPACQLLERVYLDRENYNKQLKSKARTKKEDSSSDVVFALPEGWSWVRLDEVAAVIRGVTYKKHDAIDSEQDGYVALLRANNIGHRLNFDKQIYIPKKLAKNEQIIRKGDLLIAMSSGSANLVGKAAQAEDDIEATFGAFCGVIRSYSSELEEYFRIYFSSPHYRKQTQASGKGIGIQNLTRAALDALIIPIPSKIQMEKTVGKVDELMALCDALEFQQENSITAHQTLVETLLSALTNAGEKGEFTQAWSRIAEHFDTLFTTEHSIDQLKQTILQLAVMGKLVPQDPSDEPASVLLEKIAAEKEQLIKEKKIKKQKILEPVSIDELLELPPSWQWCTLQQLITVMDAGWSPACPPEPSPSDDKWGILKTTSVQSMEYRQYENKVLADSKAPKPQYEVNVGDILITRAGPRNRVGVSCLVESTRPKLMISDKIIRFHLVDVGLYERYISLCLNAGLTNKYIDSVKSGMAESQVNISQDKLKLAPIPLPPIHEQKKIIEAVDEFILLCDQFKDKLVSAQTIHFQITDAIIKKANFS